MSSNRLKLNADKTELLFASSSHICDMLSGRYPVLHLGADTAVACSHVRLLGVDISSDLSLDLDKLQHVLNAAARVVTGTRKFDRGLGQILHDELYWLHVPDRVFFKLAVIVHRCVNCLLYTSPSPRDS